jgi:hypothetical protein
VSCDEGIHRAGESTSAGYLKPTPQ